MPRDRQGQVSPRAPGNARRLGTLTDVFGLLNLVAGAGVIAVTTVLAMRAAQSARWWAVGHWLP